jgi:hypothetical protein
MFRFVLDEHMRGKLVDSIRQRNADGTGTHLDVVVVGEPPDLPRGTLDSDILLWAEREGRLLVTFDKRSMPGHITDHLAGGHHSPGILCVRRYLSIAGIIAELEIVEVAGRPDDFADTITYLP